MIVPRIASRGRKPMIWPRIIHVVQITPKPLTRRKGPNCRNLAYIDEISGIGDGGSNACRECKSFNVKSTLSVVVLCVTDPPSFLPSMLLLPALLLLFNRNCESGTNGKNRIAGSNHLKACPDPIQTPHHIPTTIQLSTRLSGLQHNTSPTVLSVEMGLANMTSNRKTGAGSEAIKS